MSDTSIRVSRAIHRRLAVLGGKDYSIGEVIKMLLDDFVPEETEICPDCGADVPLDDEGCITCENCGYSDCEENEE